MDAIPESSWSKKKEYSTGLQGFKWPEAVVILRSRNQAKAGVAMWSFGALKCVKKREMKWLLNVDGIVEEFESI